MCPFQWSLKVFGTGIAGKLRRTFIPFVVYARRSSHCTSEICKIRCLESRHKDATFSKNGHTIMARHLKKYEIISPCHDSQRQLVINLNKYLHFKCKTIRDVEYPSHTTSSHILNRRLFLRAKATFKLTPCFYLSGHLDLANVI